VEHSAIGFVLMWRLWLVATFCHAIVSLLSFCTFHTKNKTVHRVSDKPTKQYYNMTKEILCNESHKNVKRNDFEWTKFKEVDLCLVSLYWLTTSLKIVWLMSINSFKAL
jgi:hypothetical protein